MLKRKDLPWQERNREALRLRNIFFTATIERMSAENILLDEAQDTDAESFHAALAERTGLRFSFPRERIEGTFMREGRFVSFDKRRAAEVLFSHTTDVWLYDDPNYTAYKSGTLIAFSVNCVRSRPMKRRAPVFPHMAAIFPTGGACARMTYCAASWTAP